MSDVMMVFCTFPDLATARRVGTTLVEKQLAACVNLLPGTESIYRWRDQIESASEVMAIFKTLKSSYPALAEALATLHPYEVPEIIACRAEEVARPYLEWVASNLVSPSVDG